MYDGYIYTLRHNKLCGAGYKFIGNGKLGAAVISQDIGRHNAADTPEERVSFRTVVSETVRFGGACAKGTADGSCVCQGSRTCRASARRHTPRVWPQASPPTDSSTAWIYIQCSARAQHLFAGPQRASNCRVVVTLLSSFPPTLHIQRDPGSLGTIRPGGGGSIPLWCRQPPGYSLPCVGLILSDSPSQHRSKLDPAQTTCIVCWLSTTVGSPKTKPGDDDRVALLSVDSDPSKHPS